MKEPACFRQIQQAPYAHRAGGFAENSNVVRITAERRDIVRIRACGYLVQKSLIPGGGYFALSQLVQVQKSQGSQPIIDGDQDDVAVFSHVPVLHIGTDPDPRQKAPPWIQTITGPRASSSPGEKIFKNRQSCPGARAFPLIPERHRALRSGCAIFFRRSDSLPGFERLRGQPP